MNRAILLAILGVGLSGLVLHAAEPSYGVRFIETQRKTVDVAYVDPAGLGRLMGLQKSDTIVSVNNKTIRTNDDIVEAMKNLRGAYEIKIIRPLDEKGSKTEEKTLKGEIRESKTKPGEFYLLKD
jgi:C-terminal processing protease CtpA/Prc